MERVTLRRRLSDWLRRPGSKSALRYEAGPEPDPAAVEAVRRGLVAYNEQFTGEIPQTSVAAFVRDNTGRVRGGATGYIGWGWLYVERLWVDEALRGNGVGRELMARIERLALAEGITRFQLGTTSFQALEFYQGIGYEVFAELHDHPPGFTDYFLKKTIDLSGAEE